VCRTSLAPSGPDARSAPDRAVQLVRSLDQDPVQTDFGDQFSGQDLVGAISQALYSKQMWPTLERAIASLVEDGDTRAIMAFSSGGTGLPAYPVGVGAAGSSTRRTSRSTTSRPR
jgi:hypothetical protein